MCFIAYSNAEYKNRILNQGLEPNREESVLEPIIHKPLKYRKPEAYQIRI